MSDEFKLVESKSRAKKKTRNNEDEETSQKKQAIDLYKKIETCKRNLKDYDNNLYASKVIYQLKETLRVKLKGPSKIDIVSYGLGSPDENLASRYQFALLLIIIDALKLNLDLELVELFDPAFTQLDLRVIQDLYKLKITTTNEKSMRTVSKVTLFYMPHCPKALYNNLLYANWSVEDLSRLIIFGNSFTTLKNMLVNGKNEDLSRCYSYLSDACLVLDEVELDYNCESTNAFLDLNLNLFKNFFENINCFVNVLKEVYDADILKKPIYSENEEIV